MSKAHGDVHKVATAAEPSGGAFRPLPDQNTFPGFKMLSGSSARLMVVKLDALTKLSRKEYGNLALPNAVLAGACSVHADCPLVQPQTNSSARAISTGLF